MRNALVVLAVMVLLPTARATGSAMRFEAPVVVDHVPRALAYADLDGDGVTDAVDELGVLINRKSAGFQRGHMFPAPLVDPYQVMAIDLDSDGRVDVVCGERIATTDTARVLWFRNLGGGEFAAPVHHGFGLSGYSGWFLLRDLDLDHDLDVVVDTFAYDPLPRHRLVMLRNDGDRFTAWPEIELGVQQRVDGLVRLDADEFHDLLTTSHEGVWSAQREYRPQAHLGRGAGVFAAPVAASRWLAGEVGNVAQLDFDHDGRSDLVYLSRERAGDHHALVSARRSADGELVVIQHESFDGIRYAPVPRTQLTWWQAAMPADLDDDGRIEFTGYWGYSAEISYLANWIGFASIDSAGRFHDGPAQLLQRMNHRSPEVSTGDFDGDGLLDLLERDYNVLRLHRGTTGPNRAPTLEAVTLMIGPSGGANGSMQGQDPDNHALRFRIVEGPASGARLSLCTAGFDQLVVGCDGNRFRFFYESAAKMTGEPIPTRGRDRFVVEADDGAGGRVRATVTVVFGEDQVTRGRDGGGGPVDPALLLGLAAALAARRRLIDLRATR